MWLIKSVLVAVLAQSETSPDALVRRLGSDDFSARESAEAALSKLAWRRWRRSRPVERTPIPKSAGAAATYP